MTALQRGAAAARSMKTQRTILATARIALKYRRHALATELLSMWRAERAHWSTLTA